MMKIVSVKDSRRTGQSIIPEAADKVYVFDVAGTNNDQNWVNIKATLSDGTYACIFLRSGDILELQLPHAKITKIEAYYTVAFRVVE